jgi:hypothetical protein
MGVDHPPGRLSVRFRRRLALRGVPRYPRDRIVVLLWRRSHEAVVSWLISMSSLFIDGDHPRTGSAHDWRGWSRHVVPGGTMALLGNRSVPRLPDLDSLRYTREVILVDSAFRLMGAVEPTVIECVRERGPR